MRLLWDTGSGSYIVEAPEDISLSSFLKQCEVIKLAGYEGGICPIDSPLALGSNAETRRPDIRIGYAGCEFTSL